MNANPTASMRKHLSGLRRSISVLALTLFVIDGPDIAGIAGARGDRAAAVHALFDLRALASGPFPSDWFTVSDLSHNTGRQVELPYPDCDERPSDCEDIAVINTLDGFNLQPRLSIPFDGPIDVQSATSQSVFLISLGSTLGDGHEPPSIVGINQIVWDPETNTLHVESDELLDQHTRYALIATRGVRDQTGAPVEATETFRRFRETVRGEYKHALLDAIHAARELGVCEDDIAVASVFTTQSATAILERIRDQIKAQIPEPADFRLGPDGTRTVFTRSEVTGITLRQQTRDNPPGFISATVLINLLDIPTPGLVGTIAYGKYRSPDYQVHPGEFIPPVATRTGTPEVQGTNEIYFNLFLPSGDKPASGWPVAILGHGIGSNKDLFPFRFAASMAAHGIATVAINAAGHGFGPLGTLTVNRTAGSPVTLASGGRGIDQNGDGVIGSNEGVEAAAPRRIISYRDGLRQTVVDLMQLVRVIEVGPDIDGDGSPDLDSQHVYYFGQSLGGMYGTIFLSLEPDVQVGVLTAAGASSASSLGLGVSGIRSSIGTTLAVRIPSLVNPPGLTEIDGVPALPPLFNDDMPLRDESPVISPVPGAIAIQTWLENGEWVSLSGNPLGYAPHLVKAALPGVAAKRVIYQFSKGDRNVPNPATTALLRAGDLADRATFFRNDLAIAEDGRVPSDPHVFLNRIDFAVPLVRAIALGGQEQVAIFFASDGAVIIHPEPARFFEVPILLPLPERLNFIR
jgi:hypothetical protein